MSISTYAEAATAVENWLHRADLTSNIPDFLTGADDRINREVVEAEEREVSFSSTIAADGTLAVPSDYNQMKHAYISQASVQWLERKSPEWIYTNFPIRSSDSTPQFFARETSNFIFAPFPSTNYLIQGVYYRNNPALSSSACPMFTASPLLWVYAALAEAEPFMKNDKRVAVWEAKYEKIAARILKNTDKENHSGSNLRMVAG